MHDRRARHLHDDYDHWLKPAARDRARRSGCALNPVEQSSNPECMMARLSVPARGLLALIQLYKWTLSPLIGRECRYLPTCSSYAAESVRAHGAWAGSWMAAARLCRCHPFGGAGYDPPPALMPRAPWYAPWRYGDWDWKARTPAPAPDSPRAAGETGKAPPAGARRSE